MTFYNINLASVFNYFIIMWFNYTNATKEINVKEKRGGALLRVNVYRRTLYFVMPRKVKSAP